MANEPIQGGPYPSPNDSPDGPGQMKSIVDWAAGRLNMRFASTAARDAAIPSPVAGMECTIGTGNAQIKCIHNGSVWRTFYEDTGWVQCTSIAADTAAGLPAFNAAGLYVRRVAERVELRGVVNPGGVDTFAAGAMLTVAQIPVGFRRPTAGYFGGGVAVSSTTGLNFVWYLATNGNLQVRNLGVSVAYSTNSSFAPPSGWYVT